jgi:glycosyltransferase involved in cell wall biosynthesis
MPKNNPMKASDRTPYPLVTVIMPVRNEAKYIRRSLEAVLAQDYPMDRMEIIVVDGMSDDGTREIVKETIHEKHQARVDWRGDAVNRPTSGTTESPLTILLDNPSRIVSPALNRALKHTSGDVIIRVDGHCEIPVDHVSRCIDELGKTNADCVGGIIVTVGETRMAQSIAVAQSSRFGVGGVAFRTGQPEAGFVDTLAFGAYKNEVFHRIGYFDEELIRNQDDEFNYRLIHAGGSIWLSPAIRSTYYSRASLRGLWNQYFEYGYWKVRVLQKHPRQMRSRQFAPPLMVMVFLAASLLISYGGLIGSVALTPIIVYVLATLIASYSAARNSRWRHFHVFPVVFFILHWSYGLGFLIGLLRFWHRWTTNDAYTQSGFARKSC